LLASWGCDVLQGYAFSVPRNALSMSRWLDTWRDDTHQREILLPTH
jgi:EAL domain-containing protein (putative c-di-GMP-specific phosphodiesterase class I)